MSTPVKLHVRDQGDGDAIVILHGLFGSSSNWGKLSTRLAESHRVIVADLRNHGQSPHDPAMDYRSMAGDVLALLDGLELSRATVLGHSMGGKAAMALALEHGDRVERLIVADVAPVAYAGDSHEGLIDAMLALDLSRVHSRRDASDLLEPAIPESQTRQFLLTNLEQRDGAWRWRIPLRTLRDQLATIREFPELPGSYGGPTLFIRGERSEYISDDHISTIRKLFPEYRMETLPDCGHWLHAEAPDRFFAAVKQFLDG